MEPPEHTHTFPTGSGPAAVDSATTAATGSVIAEPAPPGFDQFLSILRRYLPLLDTGDDIPLTAPLRELGLNSMRAVDLLLDLEESFNAVLPDTMLTQETFSTAQTLWTAVHSVVKGTP